MAGWTLIQDRLSQQTEECFAQLHGYAQERLIVGSAFMVMLTRRRYIVNFCGAALSDATWTRGAAKVIDDKLQLIIMSGADSDTQF